MGRMRGESQIRADQIRAEQVSYRKFIEVELRSLVREASELLSREDKPDWGVVRLLLNNATGRVKSSASKSAKANNSPSDKQVSKLHLLVD